eukprot:3832093-Pyramimonas_sp.AAC.1
MAFRPPRPANRSSVNEQAHRATTSARIGARIDASRKASEFQREANRGSLEPTSAVRLAAPLKWSAKAQQEAARSARSSRSANRSSRGAAP